VGKVPNNYSGRAHTDMASDVDRANLGIVEALKIISPSRDLNT